MKKGYIIMIVLMMFLLNITSVIAQERAGQEVSTEVFAQQVRNVVSRENDILANELKENMDSDFQILDGTMQSLVKNQTRKLLFGILGMQMIICAGMMYVIVSSERKFQAIAEINRKLSKVTKENEKRQEEETMYKSLYERIEVKEEPQQQTKQQLDAIKNRKLMGRLIMFSIIMGSIFLIYVVVKMVFFTEAGL